MTLPLVNRSSLDLVPVRVGDFARRFLHPGELEVIVALVRSVHPRVVIEFGCNEGRTAAVLLSTVPEIECYQGIDVEVGYVPAKRVQRREVPTQPGHLVHDLRFELIIRPRGSLDLAAEDLLPCDAAFIDGDHGREAVEHDSELATDLVRPGGVIIWHDYHDLGTVDVRDVLDEMAGAGREINHVAGTWIAFERR